MRLGDALEVLIDHRGKTPKKLGGDWTTTGHRVVSALNIKGSRVDGNDHHYISGEMYRRWMKIPLRKGDVLLTSEAPTGEVAFISDDVDWAVGQRVFALRGNPNLLDGRYLYYALRGGQLRDDMMSRTSGTTVQGIRQAELVKVGIELPPLTEQRRIASMLGALDDKIDANRRLVETGEQLLRAKVQLAVDTSSGDSGILADYCDLVKATVKAEDITHSTNYVGFEHMPRGSVFLHDWTTSEGLGSHKASFERGDVLFGRLRPYFKKVGIAPVGGVCSTDILVIRPKNPRDLGLITCIAASDALINSLAASSTGTRMPRAAWADVASWPVPRLTESELKALDKNVTPLIDRLESVTLESRRLAALRDSLIPELLSGRVRVSVKEVVDSSNVVEGTPVLDPREDTSVADE